MTTPSVSPAEALRHLQDQKSFTDEEGFLYTLDGSCMCPKEVMAQFADRGRLHWYVPGEVGDPVTDETVWVLSKEEW